MKFIDIEVQNPEYGVRFLAKIKGYKAGVYDYEVAELWPSGVIVTDKCGYCGTEDITSNVVAWSYIVED